VNLVRLLHVGRISHRGCKGMRVWCALTPSRPANERRYFSFHFSRVKFEMIVGISIWVGMKRDECKAVRWEKKKNFFFLIFSFVLFLNFFFQK
jgi:hypothetical protein